MNILYVLIPLALMLSAAGVAAFLWAIQHGELDDLEANSWRMIFDEEQRTNQKRES